MKNPLKEWADTVRRFHGQTVGVLGDFMLDELLRGEATRISPEAPVPVVLFPSGGAGEGFAGGAGNVAANVQALGGRPIPFGAIGQDENAEKLLKLLKAQGVSCRTLLRVRDRSTPRKVRIVAQQHQLLRLDFERAEPISPATESALARRITRAMEKPGSPSGKLDALVISDYGKGSVTTKLSAAVTARARQRRIPVLVDPKPLQPEICRHATLVTPNLREAEMMAGHSMRSREDLYTHGRRLRAELNCVHLLLTRGGEGMTLFESSGGIHDINAVRRPVYDVTGAGDTVLAVLALAAAAGAPMRVAAELANLAAGRVVLKFGTATISTPDLLKAIQDSTMGGGFLEASPRTAR